MSFKCTSKTQSSFRYEAPITPDMDVFKDSAVEAFPIAIVGFAVAFSVAKVYSIKHDYAIDGNQVGYTVGSVCPCLARMGKKKNWLLMQKEDAIEAPRDFVMKI